MNRGEMVCFSILVILSIMRIRI